MIVKKRETSAPRLIVRVTLALGPFFALSTSASLAGDARYRVNAPMAFTSPEFGGETRIPAARPFVTSPYYGADGLNRSAATAEPEGRLRVKPMNLGGNY